MWTLTSDKWREIWVFASKVRRLSMKNWQIERGIPMGTLGDWVKRLDADFGRLHTAAPINTGKAALPTRPCRQLCRAAGAGNFGEQLAGQCQVFVAVHSCSICAPAEERTVFGLLGGDEEEISSWRNACYTTVAKSCTKSTGEKAQQNNDLSFMIWKMMFQVYDLDINDGQNNWCFMGGLLHRCFFSAAWWAKAQHGEFTRPFKGDPKKPTVSLRK